MEIRQLSYFVAIAECGSFSEASRRCFISQSAISQQIKLLEDELGVTLFIRSSHHLSLTECGRALLPLAKDAIRDVNLCKERLADFRGMLNGQLSIGLTYSLEPYVRDVIVQFIKRYPKVQLSVWYKTLPELIVMLREHDLDIAFGIKVEGEEDWVDAVPVMQYRLCAVMRDTHPLASREELFFDDLRMQRLVLPEAGIRDQNAAEHYLSEKASVLQYCTYINSASAILSVIRESNCISILPEHIIEETNGLCAIPIHELSDPFTSYAYSLKGTYRKKAALTFMKLLLQGSVN
ncbi:MAG: LysR family transcriptional regulator [Bacteroidales bacterium]|nr:LysR family transcriptional regulator [Bacteroidales bacterium]